MVIGRPSPVPIRFENAEELLRPVLQKVGYRHNQVERFRSGGSETESLDARLMLAFTSEAPN
jgi:hypothetical protein